MLHFATEKRGSFMPPLRTPNGQASTQLLQPVHRAAFRRTIPSSSRVIASWGHAATQAGSSQWRHTTGSVPFVPTSVL